MHSRLYFPDYAKRLRKRGVTRKTLYSEYIKRYPQGYSYCSFNRFLRAYMASRNSLFKGFVACGLPANHSAKGLEFPRLAKVVSQMVWHFRAWRKSFPKWFGVSTHGESRFPKGLEFPRMAKVVSQMVWCSRVWRKSFPEWFGVSAHGESYFPNGLELVVAKIWKLTVQRNGHVRLLGHYYSVPHIYVGKKVTVFYTSQHVEIYQYYRLIAQHIRNYQGFGFTTIKEHLPAAHRLYLEEEPTPYLKRAKEMILL